MGWVCRAADYLFESLIVRWKLQPLLYLHLPHDDQTFSECRSIPACVGGVVSGSFSLFFQGERSGGSGEGYSGATGVHFGGEHRRLSIYPNQRTGSFSFVVAMGWILVRLPTLQSFCRSSFGSILGFLGRPASALVLV